MLMDNLQVQIKKKILVYVCKVLIESLLRLLWN